ncbi:MAG: DUF2273 domain-containing protein [Caldicoprobacterales bacterium]|jgi:uncharacterized membrane protein|nr:DUF2273 domain-containing protein [Bacillota bacterium]NLH59050.1 DUF2273 domain-containing protein [Clostridiales bacterium]
MTLKEIVVSCFTKHKGKTVGILCGLLFGIIVLLIGFFRSLFLLACIGIGYWIGNLHDKQESFLAFLDKILPNGLRK